MNNRLIIILNFAILFVVVSCNITDEKIVQDKELVKYSVDTLWFDNGNGNIKSITHYKNGIKHGKETFFVDSGEMVEGTFNYQMQFFILQI